MKIQNLLNDLGDILKKNNASVLKYFDEGISRDYFLNKINFYYGFDTIDESIIDLYKWHNGVRISDSIPVLNYISFHLYFFLSIDDLIETIRFVKAYNFIEKGYLPIFSNGLGEYLVTDKYASKILYCGSWDPDTLPYTPIYDNLETMIRTIIKCYNDNAYYFDANGHIQIDFDLAHSISASMNPNSDFWKEN